MYKNLAATPVAACLTAPIFCQLAAPPSARKGGWPVAAALMAALRLLPDAPNGFAR